MKTNNDPYKLCPCIRAKYFLVVEYCEMEKIPLTTLETIRTLELQKHYLDIGVSKTLHSMHLPQPPNGLSLAFDIAPTEYLPLRGWNPNGPLWLKIAQFSRSIGLTPGAFWTSFVDKPHHQYPICHCNIVVSK